MDINSISQAVIQNANVADETPFWHDVPHGDPCGEAVRFGVPAGVRPGYFVAKGKAVVDLPLEAIAKLGGWEAVRDEELTIQLTRLFRGVELKVPGIVRAQLADRYTDGVFGLEGDCELNAKTLVAMADRVRVNTKSQRELSLYINPAHKKIVQEARSISSAFAETCIVRSTPVYTPGDVLLVDMHPDTIAYRPVNEQAVTVKGTCDEDQGKMRVDLVVDGVFEVASPKGMAVICGGQCQERTDFLQTMADFRARNPDIQDLLAVA